MRRPRTIALVGATVLLLAVGFFFLRGPKPQIEIKAEELFSIGPLPVTNTILTSWLAIAIILVFCFFATRRMRLVPRGAQNFLEVIVQGIYNLVVTAAGEKNGRRFFPVVATMLIYITVVNWFALFPIFNAIGKVEPLGPEDEAFREDAVVVREAGVSLILPGAEEVEIHVDESPCDALSGEAREGCIHDQREEAIAAALEEKGIGKDERVGVLIPYFRSVNTDLMAPLSIAIASAIFVEYWGITTFGLFRYGRRFFNFGRLLRGRPTGLVDAMAGLLELVAEAARLISFSFRLFGNMMAGEIVLLMATFLIPFVVAVPFYGLEMLVGVIQAFIFGMLTLVFAILAVSEHGGEEHA